MKDTHIKGIETFVNLLFAAAAFTYASTSRYRYRYCAECTRLFNGCCLLQTIKAAFPPLPGPPVMPVYGCVCVCVCHGCPLLLLLFLFLLLLGCSAFQAAKAHKREESSSPVASRLVSYRLCAPVSWMC